MSGGAGGGGIQLNRQGVAKCPLQRDLTNLFQAGVFRFDSGAANV